MSQFLQHLAVFLRDWTIVAFAVGIPVAALLKWADTPDPFAACASPLSFRGLDQ